MEFLSWPGVTSPRIYENGGPHSVDKGSSIAMSSDVDRRLGLDPALLWMWHRLAAVAPILPLGWEFPYAMGVTQKDKKKKKKSVEKYIYFCVIYIEALVSVSSGWDIRKIESQQKYLKIVIFYKSQ